MPCSTPPTMRLRPESGAGLPRTAVVLSDATPLLAHIRRRSGLRDRDAAETRPAVAAGAGRALGFRAAGLTVRHTRVVDETDARARGIGAAARIRIDQAALHGADLRVRNGDAFVVLGLDAVPRARRYARAPCARSARAERVTGAIQAREAERAARRRRARHAHRALAGRGAFDAAGEIGEIARLARATTALGTEPAYVAGRSASARVSRVGRLRVGAGIDGLRLIGLRVVLARTEIGRRRGLGGRVVRVATRSASRGAGNASEHREPEHDEATHAWVLPFGSEGGSRETLQRRSIRRTLAHMSRTRSND